MAYCYEEHINNQAVRDFFENRAYGCAGLAEGTNAHTIKTSNAVHFEVGGQAYIKAATDNIAMTACTEQAANMTALYLVTISAAGTVTLTKGTDVAASGTPVLPACPADSAVLGALKVALANDATFTSGTTDLSATDVTATYANFGFYPENGDVSRFTFA